MKIRSPIFFAALVIMLTVDSGSGQESTGSTSQPAKARPTRHPENAEQSRPPNPNPTESRISDWVAYFCVSGESLPPWARTLRRPGRSPAGKLLANADILKGLNSDANLIGERNINDRPRGKNSGNQSNFMKMIRKDNGKAWKDYVSKEAIKILKVKSNGHTHYWHLGNEISSLKHSRKWREWAGLKLSEARRNDPELITIFAEYYLAPTIDALNNAEKTSQRDIPIVLGSIGNSHSKANRLWYDKLITYEFKGTFAPLLKGKKVLEAVDFISYHYLINSPNWEPALNDLSKWVGKGSIKGMWDSEELGYASTINGISGAIALRSFARYLHWWGLKAWGPDKARVNYWNWDKGKGRGKREPNANGSGSKESMAVLYNFLGKGALREIRLRSDSEFRLPAESYCFETENQRKQVIVILGPKSRKGGIEEGKKGKGGEVSFSSLNLPLNKHRGITSGRACIFSERGLDEMLVDVVSTQSAYVLKVPESIRLSNSAVALFLLDLKR